MPAGRICWKVVGAEENEIKKKVDMMETLGYECASIKEEKIREKIYAELEFKKMEGVND